MKNTKIYILVLITFLIIPSVTFAAWWNPSTWRIWDIFKNIQTTKQNIKTCTQDAKLCPDGSSVYRAGANCEFTSCPELTSQQILDAKNKEKDANIRANLSMLLVNYEVYYNQGSTYLGMCPQKNGCDKIILAISSSLPSDGKFIYKEKKDGTQFCATVNKLNSENSSWCVDSTGYRGIVKDGMCNGITSWSCNSTSDAPIVLNPSLAPKLSLVRTNNEAEKAQIDIKWTQTSGATSYKIYRKKTKSSAYGSPIAEITTGDLSSGLAVNYGENSYIVVKGCVSNASCVSSNELFVAKMLQSSIVPKITVIYPTGGETLVIGGTYKIKWKTENFTDQKLQILLIYKNTRTGIAENILNTGEYIWIIQNGTNISVDASGFKISVEAMGGPYFGESQGEFAIVESSEDIPPVNGGSDSGQDNSSGVE